MNAPAQHGPQSLHRPVHDTEIPALSGLDPNTSRFSLCNRFRNQEPLPTPDHSDPRVASTTALLAAAVASNPFGAPCRPSTATISLPSLPLQASPQITIPEAPQFGDGVGIAILCPLSWHEWTRNWHPASGQPRTPPAITARLDAIMLCCAPAQWAAVIPFIDTTSFKAPVVLPRSQERTDILTRDLCNFIDQVHGNAPILPDDRSTPDYLKMIQDASATQAHPVEPPHDIANQLRGLMAKHRDYRQTADTAYARGKEMMEKCSEIEDAIARIVAENGQGSLIVTTDDGTPILLSAQFEHQPARPRSPQPIGRLVVREQ